MIEDLVSKVFTTRNAAHLAHWKTKSFSQHNALGDFYEDSIDAVDTVVEAYQGAYDLINVGMLQGQPAQFDIIAQLQSDLEFIAKDRQNITKGSAAIDNKLQELEGVYLKTLYKLKNLA